MNIKSFKKGKTIRAYVLIEADGTLERGTSRIIPSLWANRHNAKSWTKNDWYGLDKVVAVDVTIKVVGS